MSDEGYYTIRFVDTNDAWLAGNGKIAKMPYKLVTNNEFTF